MTQQATTQDHKPTRSDGSGTPRVRFTLDANLGLSVAEKSCSDFLPAHGIEADIGYGPMADLEVVVRHDLDPAVCTAFLDRLLAWTPPWNTVYGGFKPSHAADVHAFFHDLGELPDGL